MNINFVVILDGLNKLEGEKSFGYKDDTKTTHLHEYYKMYFIFGKARKSG